MTERSGGQPAQDTVEQSILPDGKRVWMINRYDEARQVLNDVRFSNDAERMGAKAPLSAAPREIKAVIARDMLNNDPPEHSRLRRLVAPTFTARRISAFRPSAERIADELLDALAGQHEVDLVDEYAAPMATRALAELIGIPVQDCPRVNAWSETFVLELLTNSDELLVATKALHGYTRELVERKRTEPGDDLVSELISVREGGDRLSDDELSAMIFILLIAGQLATAQLMAKGYLLLLTHPEQLARLRAEPALLSGAVAEFLRYDPPLRLSFFRMATEPVEVSGVTIPAGDIAVCALFSANHDEARFSHAERLDICRTSNQHLAFGQGIHRCLGSNLAELEAEAAIGALVRRFKQPRLAIPVRDIRWEERGLMKQLVELPVILGRDEGND